MLGRAKTSLAAERRVTLRISDATNLDRLVPEDAADVATVVGNLVDNAMDAAATTTAPDDPDRWDRIWGEIRSTVDIRCWDWILSDWSTSEIRLVPCDFEDGRRREG